MSLKNKCKKRVKYSADISEKDKQKIVAITGSFQYPSGEIKYEVELGGASEKIWISRNSLSGTKLLEEYENRPRQGRGKRNFGEYHSRDQCKKTQKISTPIKSTPKKVENKKILDQNDNKNDFSKTQKLSLPDKLSPNKVKNKSKYGEKNKDIQSSKTNEVYILDESAQSKASNKRKLSEGDKDIHSSEAQEIPIPDKSAQKKIAKKDSNSMTNKRNNPVTNKKIYFFRNSRPISSKYHNSEDKCCIGYYSFKTRIDSNLKKIDNSIDTNLLFKTNQEIITTEDLKTTTDESTLMEVDGRNVHGRTIANDYSSKSEEISTPEESTLNKVSNTNIDDENIVSNCSSTIQEIFIPDKSALNELGNKNIDNSNIANELSSKTKKMSTFGQSKIDKDNDKNLDYMNILSDNSSKSVENSSDNNLTQSENVRKKVFRWIIKHFHSSSIQKVSAPDESAPIEEANETLFNLVVRVGDSFRIKEISKSTKSKSKKGRKGKKRRRRGKKSKKIDFPTIQEVPKPAESPKNYTVEKDDHNIKLAKNHQNVTKNSIIGNIRELYSLLSTTQNDYKSVETIIDKTKDKYRLLNELVERYNSSKKKIISSSSKSDSREEKNIHDKSDNKKKFYTPDKSKSIKRISKNCLFRTLCELYLWSNVTSSLSKLEMNEEGDEDVYNEIMENPLLSTFEEIYFQYNHTIKKKSHFCGIYGNYKIFHSYKCQKLDTECCLCKIDSTKNLKKKIPLFNIIYYTVHNKRSIDSENFRSHHPSPCPINCKIGNSLPVNPKNNCIIYWTFEDFHCFKCKKLPFNNTIKPTVERPICGSDLFLKNMKFYRSFILCSSGGNDHFHFTKARNITAPFDYKQKEVIKIQTEKRSLEITDGNDTEFIENKKFKKDKDEILEIFLTD